MNIYLIAGFNNWGKSTAIREIFGRKNFRKNKSYKFDGKDFGVLSRSNDDDNIDTYLKNFHDTAHGISSKRDRMLAAFCATAEENKFKQNSLYIIDQMFNSLTNEDDRIYLIPLEYKWCGHARLELYAIHKFYTEKASRAAKVAFVPHRGPLTVSYYDDLKDRLRTIVR